MNKRKFKYFSDEELNTFVELFGSNGELNLLKAVKEEQRIREFSRKRHDEWIMSRPRIRWSFF